MQDRSGPDTIPIVSAYACMIVGLKYVGASDDLPIRIAVGHVVDLRREPCHPQESGVAAYYDGTRVGYLSPDRQPFWESLDPSARCRAKVMGEILDEDGNLAALDIEIDVPPGCDERVPGIESAVAEKVPRRGTLGTAIGFAVLFLTIMMAGADSTGPAVPALSRTTLGGSVDRPPAKNLAPLLQRREMQKRQQLAEDLRQAQAENRRLESDIAQLRLRIEKMSLAKGQLEAEERKQLALMELNQEELVRHENRLAAWTLVNQAAQAQKAENARSALRQVPKEETKIADAPTDKPEKRKKANFSRYAQENRNLE
ncbi:MAG: hypothetical protein ACREDW_10840 [Aestuariivirgaceae bacterium]